MVLGASGFVAEHVVAFLAMVGCGAQSALVGLPFGSFVIFMCWK